MDKQHQIIDFLELDSKLSLDLVGDIELIKNVFKAKVIDFLISWGIKEKIEKQLEFFNIVCFNILEYSDKYDDNQKCSYVVNSYIRDKDNRFSPNKRKNRLSELFSRKNSIWEEKLDSIISVLINDSQIIEWIVDNIWLNDVINYNINSLDSEQQDYFLQKLYENLKEIDWKNGKFYKEILIFILWDDKYINKQKWAKYSLIHKNKKKIYLPLVKKLVISLINRPDLCKWLIDLKTWKFLFSFEEQEDNWVIENKQEKEESLKHLFDISDNLKYEIKKQKFINKLLSWTKRNIAEKQKEFFIDISKQINWNWKTVSSKIFYFVSDLEEADYTQLRRLFSENKPIKRNILYRIIDGILNEIELEEYLLNIKYVNYSNKEVLYYLISNLWSSKQKEFLLILYDTLLKLPKFKDIVKKRILEKQSALKNFINPLEHNLEEKNVRENLREVLFRKNSKINLGILKVLIKRLFEEKEVLLSLVDFLEIEKLTFEKKLKELFISKKEKAIKEMQIAEEEFKKSQERALRYWVVLDLVKKDKEKQEVIKQWVYTSDELMAKIKDLSIELRVLKRERDLLLEENQDLKTETILLWYEKRKLEEKSKSEIKKKEVLSLIRALEKELDDVREEREKLLKKEKEELSQKEKNRLKEFKERRLDMLQELYKARKKLN